MKIDLEYINKKWSKKEKQSVINLREKGKFPKEISKKTGIPINQVKFWIYGPRNKNNKKKQPQEQKNKNSMKHYYRTKFNDWYQWKASTLASSFKKRDKNMKPLSRPKIKEWLLNQARICPYCKIELHSENLGVDHDIPLSRGGKTTLNNLICCCRNCNTIKGDMVSNEYLELLNLVSKWEDKGKSLFGRLKASGFTYR